jgi:type II secretory pathway pseudopilin PulG
MTLMSQSNNQPYARQHERGYTLVALLALMTILVLMAMSAAPVVRQQTQRELEKESIARGEEVAEAIVRYTRLTGAPPTELQQLVDGVTPPGSIKKVQILRASAAHDPLSKSGEWKLVHPGDKVVGEFQDRVMKYTNGVIPDTREAFFKQFVRQITGLSDLNKDTDTDKPECGEDSEPNTSAGPFIGVVSRNRCASVITYYGIDRHDLWVFTPLFR